MGITNDISRYISDNHLSVSQIAYDTGIAEEKMTSGTAEVLTSGEMLDLCSYLRIKPEEIMEKYHDHI